MEQSNKELADPLDVKNLGDDYVYKKGVVYKNLFHIIFCPKYRRKVLVDGIENRLREILFQIASEKDIEIKSLEIKPDHVHMIINFAPQLTLHKIVKDFKSLSSGILREEYPSLRTRIPSLWTRSYLACSIGQKSDELIQEFIENQKNA